MEPPKPTAIDAGLESLTIIGALEPASESRYQLTALGEILARIPADVRLAKLLIISALLKCVSTVVTVAACLSHKPPFASSF